MKLTIVNRLKLCFEILTIKSKHAHTVQEKQLSIFQHGYQAGITDQKLEDKNISIKDFQYAIEIFSATPSEAAVFAYHNNPFVNSMVHKLSARLCWECDLFKKPCPNVEVEETSFMDYFTGPKDP